MGLLCLGLVCASSGGRVPARAEAPSRFQVVDFNAGFGPKLDPAAAVTVLERPEFARYETPWLRMGATVRCRPLAEAHTVGFIQQVDAMEIRYEYDRATVSVELPRLPVNDSSGEALPWYHHLHERREVKAGTREEVVEISLDDRPWGVATWRELLPPGGLAQAPERALRRITRSQRFTTWLVARRDGDGKMTVLKKVRWGFDLEVTVDCSRPLGRRCEVKSYRPLEPAAQDGAELRGADAAVPAGALTGPTCNQMQQTWWTPRREGIGRRVLLQ